jgi:hypothetical protein
MEKGRERKQTDRERRRRVCWGEISKKTVNDENETNRSEDMMLLKSILEGNSIRIEEREEVYEQEGRVLREEGSIIGDVLDRPVNSY